MAAESPCGYGPDAHWLSVVSLEFFRSSLQIRKEHLKNSKETGEQYT